MKTKSKLISSLMILTLCVTMFAGSTYAWFTDEVVSGRNIIQSGSLDVELEYKNALDGTWTPVTADTKIFKEDALYEPGYTEVVFLRVSNAGSLALKYNLKINVVSETTSTNVAGEEFALSDYLEMGCYVQDEYSSGFNYADILLPTMFGTREAALSNVTTSNIKNTVFSADDKPLLPNAESSQVIALVLTMPETVGNEANHKSDVDAPTVELGLNLTATQLPYESDSFGSDYDADLDMHTGAPSPVVTNLGALEIQATNFGDRNGANAETKDATFAYHFAIPEEPNEEYDDWYCDFVLSFDQNVPTDAVSLVGQYDAYSDYWVEIYSFDLDTEDGIDGIPAGREIMLVTGMLGDIDPDVPAFTYEMIREFVPEFNCGAIEYDAVAMDGITMTVKLCMYEPDGDDVITCGTYSYTF